MRPHSFNYSFHPVGQGLFASGAIRQMDNERVRFSWVYDCGSSSSQDLVDEAIAGLDSASGKLDLVTLSHFDHDHISGISRLAGKFHIDTLMLPYMAQEQRLWMAFEEGVPPDDDLMAFFVNPTAYLSARDGPGIRNILYVPPSGEKGPPPQPVEPPKTNPDTDGDWGMEMESQKSPGGDDPALTPVHSKTDVRILYGGQPIRLRACWEFVPYNDDTDKPIAEPFRVKVQAEKHNLVNGASLSDREQALKRLKDIYKNQFGGESEERNIISLFVHAGPIYASWKNVAVSECSQDFRPGPGKYWQAYSGYDVSTGNTQSSILYTGDGYLDTPKRLGQLIRFLGKDRAVRTGVMQVMHHGSATNWHKGVASSFKPLASIFSSDPNRKKWGHPHAEVLRDFWGFGPLQVDKQRNALFFGKMD